MLDLIKDDDFKTLKQSLPAAFHPLFTNEEICLSQAFPLFNLICKDRELVEKLRAELKIAPPPSVTEMVKRLPALTESLSDQFNPRAIFHYRLPQIIGEFPIYSRVVNKAIAQFNQLLEEAHSDADVELSLVELERRYKAILAAIKEHGAQCDVESMWTLLEMMAGWSKIPLKDLFKLGPPIQVLIHTPVVKLNTDDNPVRIQEVKQPTVKVVQNPLSPNYNFNFNGAGRLARESIFLLLNAFGMKFGGHFDAQAKTALQFVPVSRLHSIIRKQLSHHIIVWESPSFERLIINSLSRLGVRFIKSEHSADFDLLVNPFLGEPLSILNPDQVLATLKSTMAELRIHDINPNSQELKQLAHYLYELLQGFQINPGVALGIGANWDGTIDYANEDSAYPYIFNPEEADWAAVFGDISRHRQGPSEARMNAGIGATIEGQAMLTSHSYMTEIQPSDYEEYTYSALVDNLVTHLMPHPAYFENTEYTKLQQNFVLVSDEQGQTRIEHFYVPSSTGTYFRDKAGKEKQTPLYRQPGTLDVRAFPKLVNYSEQSRLWYEGNPLAAQQQQFALSMSKSVRGHVVYNPVGPDQFLEDAYYGQVLRSENGDMLPFIGVVPKNFDKKHFKGQKQELCASFVIRMKNSSHMMVRCPTFAATYNQIAARFLPEAGKVVPELPKFCLAYLKECLQKLQTELTAPLREFRICEKAFIRLFKNVVYSLYDVAQADPQFKRIYIDLFSHHNFAGMTRAKCEKFLRDLTVNRPAQVTPDCLNRYDDLLNYLKRLTAYFYPEPGDELAHEIAKQAKNHVEPLLQSANVQTYFASLALNSQTNIARTVSPGMLHAVLKHDGKPSQTALADYSDMHNQKLPSYYRDADGTPIGEIQTIDNVIDRSAKFVGASLQIAHRYKPLALVTDTLAQPYLRAKQQHALHRASPNRTLWTIGGVFEGLLWHGLIKGLWKTTVTPFVMLFDFISWICDGCATKEPPLNNPLAISAAPANTASIKTRVIAQTRDGLLNLIANGSDSVSSKNELFEYIFKVLRKLYPLPQIIKEEHAISEVLLKAGLKKSFDEYEGSLKAAFLEKVSNEEWQMLFQPLVTDPDFPELGDIFQKYTSVINSQLIQAFFKCVTDANFTKKSAEVTKENISFYILGKKQSELLKKLLNYYTHLPQKQKEQCAQLFQSQGPIAHALRKRDLIIQKTQTFIHNVISDEAVNSFLFDKQIAQFTQNLNTKNLVWTLARAPHNVKWPLLKCVLSTDPNQIEQYELTPLEREFYRKVLTLYASLPDGVLKSQVLASCQSSNKNMSAKEKAQKKWADFVEREYHHSLLDKQQVSEIFALLNQSLPTYSQELSLLTMYYHRINLADDDSINQFYDQARVIISKINQEQLTKKLPKEINEGHRLLKDFCNITMNAIVNKRLDQTNPLKDDKPNNPLANARAIKSWLVEVQRVNTDLRSLIDQQVQQAPSLDHSLWRCHCIFAVLETQNPGHKIAKTGMQALLRFRSHEAKAMTQSGQIYEEPGTYRSFARAPIGLFSGSVTMKNAIKRVEEKGFSLQ